MHEDPTKQISRLSAQAREVLSALDQEVEKLEKIYLEQVERRREGLPISFFAGDTRTVGFENGSLYFRGKGGNKEPVTWGELRVASLFGYQFKFGEEHTSEQVLKDSSYDEAKWYFTSIEYMQHGQSIDNRRMAFIESQDYLNRPHSDVAYEELYEDTFRDEIKLRPGKIAEKMFLAYLIKEQQDQRQHVYMIYDPGPIEDVEYKVDIMLQGEFSDAEPASVGIQFTTDPSDESMRQKEKLVERGFVRRKHAKAFEVNSYHIIASDIVGDALVKAYYAWRKVKEDGTYSPVQKCDPRGPLSLLTTEDIEELKIAIEPLMADLNEIATVTKAEYYSS